MLRDMGGACSLEYFRMFEQKLDELPNVLRDKKYLKYLFGESAFRNVHEVLRNRIKHFKSDSIKYGL